MNKNGMQLNDWAIKKIESEYGNDVCLLLGHKTLKLEKDMGEATFSFYIPATNRANGLAKTFIIDGIGYDLFPMSWERIGDMADVKEYNTTCLADGEILWARSDEDRQRFESLKGRLAANLQNPQYMRERAVKWINFAKDIYQDTLFEEKLYKVREYAGHICDLLSIAVAFVNLRYFKHGQTNQIQELAGMEKVPQGFVELYKNIIIEPMPDAQKRLCFEIIKITGKFLDAQNAKAVSEVAPDFAELAAWYHELCYMWRRVYHWCDENDAVNAYIWCCNLQNAVDEMGAKFGIEDTDIFSYFNAKDLAKFRNRAECVEQVFRQAIASNGVKIDEYETVQDFLHINS